MIPCQSAPPWRVTVTKSFTPNSEATPGVSNTAAAKGLPAAAWAFGKLMVEAKRVSSTNFIALGFGVGEAEAVAMTGIVGVRRRSL